MQSQETRTRLQFLELESFLLSPEKFKQFIHSEVKLWEESVRESGIKLD